MESGRRFSRCPQKRSSSAHGCWIVRSRWAVKPPLAARDLTHRAGPGAPTCLSRVFSGLLRRDVGTAVSSSDQKKRKERDGRGPGWWETRRERGDGLTAVPSLVWEVFLLRVCL